MANQCEYHPQLDQTVLLGACRAAGVAFVSYSPPGKGGALADPAIAAIARAHGKTPGQVILRWHVQQPGVCAIPKSATPARIRENIDIFDFSLTEDEMAALSRMTSANTRTVNPPIAPCWD